MNKMRYEVAAQSASSPALLSRQMRWATLKDLRCVDV